MKLSENLTKSLNFHRVGFFPKPSIGARIRGENIRFEDSSQHPLFGMMPLGKYSYSHSFFSAKSIGRYCSIALGVKVMGHSHPVDWVTTSTVPYNNRRRKKYALPLHDGSLDYSSLPEPVTIGHSVWIGQDVLLRDGITISNGAIVAAGSVVTKNVAANTIVGGNPARVIRRRPNEKVYEKLEDLKWWTYDLKDFVNLPFNEPENFVQQFEALSLSEMQVTEMSLQSLANESTEL